MQEGLVRISLALAQSSATVVRNGFLVSITVDEAMDVLRKAARK